MNFVHNSAQPCANNNKNPAQSEPYKARAAQMRIVARFGPVAQLDRVLPSEGSGHGFESRLVHHINQGLR